MDTIGFSYRIKVLLYRFVTMCVDRKCHSLGTPGAIILSKLMAPIPYSVYPITAGASVKPISIFLWVVPMFHFIAF